MRIGKKHGIMPELLGGWAVDIEDMERLAETVSNEKRKAVQQAADEAKRGKAGREGEPTEGELRVVLKHANADFAAGKISAAEFQEIVASVEVKAQGSQNPDPLARANEDFVAGLITEQELGAVQRQAEIAGGERSEDKNPVSRANADFAAGRITLTEFQTVIKDQEASTHLAQREARQAQIKEQIA